MSPRPSANDRHAPEMKKPVRLAAYTLTFAVGLWGGNLLLQKLTGTATIAQKSTEAMLNQPAPDFSLPDIDGNLRYSKEWAGRIQVINFWATWCPPCRSETPMFVDMQEKYGAAGLQFVGIAIDDTDKVQDFMDTYGINYPMLIGDDNAIDVAKQYGNRFGALPYTVIIDRTGQIQHVQRGELRQDVAEKIFRKLL
ncbi:Cytochrome c-type biogenesis protein ResA [hydrothermal vent metagenome]|uniref:Cytochrome c-type biogenesis protein ResA n=1 Tax=hydrothermal vent metagenome TaxID=652676 RepID=A0A3B1AI96_9ZZZZ